MLNRRHFISLGLGAALLASTSALAFAQTATTPDLPLVFDPGTFETLSETITTDRGDRVVTYRFYKAIPYVARPVDVAYQSLNISVPVEIDGVAIDASAAPILFANAVGGYMPSSTAEATGIDASPMGPMPAGMKPSEGAMTEAPTGSAMMMAMGERVSLAKYALASGYVVVEPGARGRTLVDAEGVYYGTAPAAIVDLKAAVRYLKANAGRVPGNTDWVISTGTSAGGALSSLLGATGNSPLYAPYLEAIGAAPGNDAVFAAGCWCPITDLEHADMAYEWNWGTNPLQDGGAPDPVMSSALAAGFPAYQESLALSGRDGFGPLTADTYGPYLVRTFLLPEATAHLAALSDADRTAYLAANPSIGWDGEAATFDWTAFLAHVGPRKKAAPAFDALDLSSGENNLFGTGTTMARHFTDFAARQASGDDGATVDKDIPDLLALMNPMPFLAAGHAGRARHWWIRVGAKDTDTSLTVVGNLTAQIEKLGDDVNTRFYWDEGHGANTDPGAFIDWIADLTGYARA